MQPTQQNIPLPLKAAYFGSGSIVVLILEVLAIYFGVSDGSLLYVAPLLISPFLGITGLVLGVVALKRKNQRRGLAILGIVCGSMCIALFVGFIAFVVALASALQGIF